MSSWWHRVTHDCFTMQHGMVGEVALCRKRFTRQLRMYARPKGTLCWHETHARPEELAMCTTWQQFVEVSGIVPGHGEEEHHGH